MPKISVADAKSYFVTQGYSDIQASAIVGGLSVESGSGNGTGFLNLNAINPGDGADGSNSVGIAQWNGSRATNLNTFISAHPELGNNAQLAFVDYELRNDPASTGNAYKYLKNSTNAYDATSAFLRFEKPAGYKSSNPMNAVTASTRLAATNRASNIKTNNLPDNWQQGAYNQSANGLSKDASKKATDIKPADEVKQDPSIAKAILLAANQQSATLAAATAGASAAAVGSAAATNKTSATVTESIMAWFSNRILQIAIFIVAFLVLGLGLYVMVKKA